MFEDQQAVLLEQYLQKLRKDIDAVPPAGLDPATAAFARKLMRSRPRRAAPDAADRVWSHVLTATRQPDQKDIQERQAMLISATRPVPVRRATNYNLVGIAAAAAALMFGVMLVIAMNMRPDSQPPTAAGIVQQQDEETPIPIITASQTPVPTPPPFATRVHSTVDTEDYAYVVTAYVPILQGERIREDMLVVVLWPPDFAPSDAYASIEQVVGQYAMQDIPRFQPLTNIGVGFEQIPLAPTATPIQVSSVSIDGVSGLGDIDDETVTLINAGDTIDISGWTLRDGDGNVYMFPENTQIGSGETLAVFTKQGEDTLSTLYWGLDEAVLASGELLRLTDNNNQNVAIFRVP
ncbi:MAG: lamin tail domain-containing protein [Chloroflexota bacterium]